ncbi:MAG: hypothetical protein WBN22_03615 [Verrucomicrobiia bacterium]
MKHFGKIAVCFASGLVLNTGLCADNGVLQKNPYVPIVTRNIFDLNPPQAVAPTTTVEPPSKITPDGIMTIFGTRQVLFKATVPPRPPEPATEKSYILSEGQQQDDIEVTHIDEKAGVVTFNNHGVVQDIPLVKAPPITTPTPVIMNSGSLPPGGAPGGFNGGGNFGRFGNRSDQNGSVGNNGGNNPGGNYGGTGGGSTQPQLSPEEQMIMIAAQKAQAKQNGDPIWKIYPPTELDEAAGTVNSAPPGDSPSP